MQIQKQTLLAMAFSLMLLSVHFDTRSLTFSEVLIFDFSLFCKIYSYLCADRPKDKTMDGHGIRYKGAGLGVFGLQSWAPLREPGQPATAASVNSVSHSDKQSMIAARSEQPQLQQQCHEAQSSVPYSMRAECAASYAGNSSDKNSNVVKPGELFM